MKDFANWIYAIIGIILAVGSAINEGFAVAAWAGVMYAFVFAVILGFGEKLMRQISWKDYGLRIAFCTGGGIIATLLALLF